MDPITRCPDPERLRKLVEGVLTDDTVAGLIAHLDACPACRASLDSLSAGPLPSLGLEPPAASELRRAIEELKGSPGTRTESYDPGPEDAFETRTAPQPAAEYPAAPARIGPYQIHAEIGAGGMGRVFRAFDPALRRVVAIKVMAPHLAGNATARQRFLREARAAAAVAHDHVVTIHGVEEGDGGPYIVMQYVRGQSLEERIRKSGPLSPAEVLRVGMQAARGLAAAHAQGVIHRDIKPGNILLENGIERVKITDFGLARAAEDEILSRPGDAAGTPAYMAPEQARGERVDHRADLFSLGGVLYAMCTGRPPFRGDTAYAVVKQVCDEPHRPVLQVNPEASPAVAAVIDRLLAKAPGDRYQSAEEVAAELERLLAGAQGPRVPPSPRRSPRWVLVAVAFAVILLVAVAWAADWFKPPATPDIGSIAGVPGPGPAPSPGETPAPPRQSAEVPPGAPLPPWSLPPGAPPPALNPYPANRAAAHQQAWAQYLGQKPVIENGLKMKFALIPPGEFDTVVTGGSASGARPEHPRVRYRITRPYYLGVTEVTHAQFRAFVDDTAYTTLPERTGKGGRAWHAPPGRVYTWKNPGPYPPLDSDPVTLVAAADAVAFCEWLTRKEGVVHRLPTGAEWEYAAAAGGILRFGVCNNLWELRAYGRFEEDVRRPLSPTSRGPAPVGGKKPNGFGLHDVLGNVWEYQSDEAGLRIDEIRSVIDPVGPKPRGMSTRGQAWTRPSNEAMLGGLASDAKDGPGAYNDIGFRVLRELP